jgi:hypothetical protein
VAGALALMIGWIARRWSDLAASIAAIFVITALSFSALSARAGADSCVRFLEGIVRHELRRKAGATDQLLKTEIAA